MLHVVIPTSLTTFIPIMKVPNFQIGMKVCDELKGICPDEIFAMVSGDTEYEVENYTHWKWNFQT